MTDQYKMQDPVKQYTKAGPEFEQQQNPPGLEQEMNPLPDAGQDTYRGTGRLAGRKAIVTGADSGIGRAVAVAFAREGADVVLSYMPEEEKDAQEVIKLVQEAGRTAVAVPGDLKDEKYSEQLVAAAMEKLGGIDILANIAGMQQFVPEIADLTTEQFDATFKTNVYGLFWLCKAALKHMKPGSTIINTSSIQAYEPSPILLDYATTKAAINTFSKSLAQQVAGKGIRVNVVAPGPVWTPLQVSGGQPTEVLKDFGAKTPLGRPGQPAEMAPAYVFLASQESSYISGETLNANGGMPTP
ncbi:NAD(P)-dependent dehydrogenase, short-chain alcohol dehydrogenase family [Paenibacillus jilunlii]|uniref:NAD(P)-dependent dehydrogenase, short-chain alcohol dehydrogenase family n=2 Tax=Paenibacillus jilunlii TaxID=682956 RepID=A0A1G9J6P9_9BACL|nr:SDR family oxidoreductase [Paenibacillus jilunlii]KWX74782.1 oxidoreductase [Paenibacillus jilunlii]SDL33021.1 NAD(P)-dependent dehydrogenase, short-chain alcohol dehydrogenase family [Paenibacillus jilunlii]